MPPSAAEFTFVHAADLHLDTPFKGVHEIAPFVARELREASLDAFDAIVELTIERGAKFLLLAGDIYDGPERGLRAQLRFRDGLTRLSRASIPTFVVHGNHDPVQQGWSAIGRWPEGVTIFSSEHVETIPVMVDGELIATVQGISYATAAVAENLARKLSRPEGPGVHIGLLHCNVAGVDAAHANYSPCTLEDLRRTRLDYLALGHVHQRRTLAVGEGPGDPTVVYPGNTQARSPRKTEREPKGAVVVHVREGRIDEVEFVACDRVRYVEVDVPIVDLADLGELEDELVAAGRQALEAGDGRSIVLRAVLTGSGELHADLVRGEVVGELISHLRDLCSENAPFCWWDEVVDATTPTVPIDSLRHRGDFEADLLDLAESLQADETLVAEITARLVSDAPRALHRHFSSTENANREDDLVSKASGLALDLLEAESR